MSTDGFGKTKLSDTVGANSQPDWSSNGKKVAFTNSNAGNSEIYWMGAWGSAEVNLTRDPANDREPSFFPDYHKIAFSSNRGGNWDIWVTTVDNQGVPVPMGTFRVGGADTPNIESQPSVSPDGNYIAFVSEDPSTRDKNIAVVTSPFSSPTKPPPLGTLCMSKASEEFPEWAPDGKNIFFASNRSGNYDIFRHTTVPPPPPSPSSPPPPPIDCSTDDPAQNLTAGSSVKDIMPALSPDGTKIAFSSQRGGGKTTYNIYRMRNNSCSSSCTQTAITTSTTNSFLNPSWQPDP